MADDYWAELARRVGRVRDAFKSRRIALKPGEGITLALDEAQVAANGAPAAAESSDDALVRSVEACQVVWLLAEDIGICEQAGLDITDHLKRITTGTIDFGVPADEATAAKVIYFKDFEAELFVASRLALAKLPVVFLPDASDPRGEMTVGPVYIEVKHPNSSNALSRLMSKFNGALKRGGHMGFFVVAIEDAFNLADTRQATTSVEFRSAQQAKRVEMETLGRDAVLRASAHAAIVGLAQTASCLEIVGDDARFARYSNSLVFDHRKYEPSAIQTAEHIAAVFNPAYRRFSQVRHLLTPGSTSVC